MQETPETRGIRKFTPWRAKPRKTGERVFRHRKGRQSHSNSSFPQARRTESRGMEGREIAIVRSVSWCGSARRTTKRMRWPHARRDTSRGERGGTVVGAQASGGDAMAAGVDHHGRKTGQGATAL